MQTSISFKQLSLSFSNYRTYLFAGAFILGNILLPQLCHLMPNGGHIWLPIYFFTLIAAYKFGVKAGLLTALLSPLCNCLLFGMPAFASLPVILIKSGLLAIAAAWMANKAEKLSLWTLLAVILFYQVVGGLAEWAIAGSILAPIQDFKIGFPGLLFQLLGGWMALKALSNYSLK